MLLRLGARVGRPHENTIARIEGLKGRRRLQALTDRILDVASWDELLGSTD